MRETMDQIWAVIENEPGFQDVPLLLGVLAVVTILYLKFGAGWGDSGGDGGGGDGGGDGC
jgi:hypothetical protein